MSRRKKCVRRGCDDAAEKCGACMKHYQQAYRRIKAGKATQEELIALKWLTTPQTYVDPLDKALRKLRAKKSA